MRRRAIHDLTEKGWTPEDIAIVLRVHVSTVYRSISRLRHAQRGIRRDVESYRAVKAQAQAG